MAGDALDGIDVHTEVGQAGDARAAGGMDGDVLRASNLRLGDDLLQRAVVGRVMLIASQVLDMLVALEYLHGAAIEDDGEGNLHEDAGLLCLDGEPRLTAHLADVV